MAEESPKLEEKRPKARYGAVRAVALLLKIGCILLIVATLITLIGGRTALVKTVSKALIEKMKEANKAMVEALKKEAGEQKAAELKKKLQTAEKGFEESAQKAVNLMLFGSALFLVFVAVLLWAASDLLRLLISVEERTRQLADNLTAGQF